MIVVDTHVASELMRPAPSPPVVAWVRAHRASELYATSSTVAEVLCGIERLAERRRRDLLGAAATAVFAATCRVQDATLATRNTRDFSDTGITVVDPWADRV